MATSHEALTALRRPDGRVYFAGDYMTNMSSWMQGAFESAREVALAIHTRALARYEGSGLVLLASEGTLPITISASPGELVFAGLLVGFGTRVGNGCTSGHGVCGIARLSPRSLAATITFMASGAIAVFVVRHLFAP